MTFQRTLIRTATIAAAFPMAAGLAMAQDSMMPEGDAMTPPAEEAMPADATNPPATMDSNGDGTMDAWDRDADGTADAWDTTGDGAPDAVDDDGDGQPDAASPE